MVLTNITGVMVLLLSSTTSARNNSPSAMPPTRLISALRHVHTVTDPTANHHPMTNTTATRRNILRLAYPPKMASSIPHTSKCCAGVSQDQQRDHDPHRHINNSRLPLCAWVASSRLRVLSLWEAHRSSPLEARVYLPEPSVPTTSRTSS